MNSEALRLIEELKTTASHPAASVRKAMAETGKKAVGCFPIYAPEELIYAAGAVSYTHLSQHLKKMKRVQ